MVIVTVFITRSNNYCVDQRKRSHVLTNKYHNKIYINSLNIILYTHVCVHNIILTSYYYVERQIVIKQYT